MSQKLFNTQKYRPKDFNGLVHDNHLSSIFQQKPQMLNAMIRNIYKNEMGQSMVNFVNQFPLETVPHENLKYEWMLKGQEEKNVPLVDAETQSGASQSAGTFPAAVGANRERFYLIFAEPFFDETEVIKGETDDYHFLIKNKEEFGGRYKYEVELVNDDLEIAVPREALAKGKKFPKLGGLVPSTLSHKGFGPYFTSPFAMENRLSQLRMEYTVPGNMINKGKNEPLEFNFSFRGKETSVWVNYIDLVVLAMAEESMAKMQLYGKKNWGRDGTYLNFDDYNKFDIASGAGFFDQIAPANRHLYNTFDLDYMVDAAMDMSIGKISRDDRGFTIVTGERGAKEIHKQIEQKQGNSWTIVSDALVNWKTDGGNLGTKNTRGYGVQFNEYQSYNGIHLKVKIADFMDNDRFFPARHPSGKGIAESHRMIVMPSDPAAAGIARVRPQDQEDIYAYQGGLRDPFTPGGMGKLKSTSSPVDGYTVHCMKFGGLKMEDPTKVMDFQLNVEQ